MEEIHTDMSDTADIMKGTTYTISELAKEFDITPRAIRFYEDQGLISPSRKGRRRVYRERDRVRLKLVLRGKRLGFALSEVKEMFDLYDTAPGETAQLRFLLGKIKDRREMLEQQRQDIEAVLHEMESVEKRAVTVLEEMGEG
ncbi:MerR family transcriptional regulator [Sedimenticola selenatireducens]|jgi:DNA-binding transcriptional MerR regulator|uniref:MerR family DNA-binding transcriptional regulator n=1 Tax=Sedimenticola selenatireducens TaxID=191960 RepID=A0A558DM39_9GAMM|nr:MerR family DNA-binding transcriptional regulator [Sedimenticola selenatireducens]TVO78724.1 MerR family DNA-binding transcriptional regulator [Sedimenticola selenatireducens]TVT62086.1 MAG: MerR family DNA-binding transcriptional regulator [Sedimenticola selenatireducens]